MKTLIFFLTAFILCVSLYAGQPQQPDPTTQSVEAPAKPKFKGSNPGIMILIGGIAALAVITKVWIVLGVVSLLLLILMILALNAAKKQNKINKKNFNTKLLVVILFFSLLFVYALIGLLILGLSFLIAAILGVEATNLFGALFIAAIGIVWLLAKIIVHAFRQ